MLGLDEASDTKDDPSSVQGAYLSFLSLRHLKIRDLQRTCISILNYFRSIERMLTINDQGLSMNAKGGVERVIKESEFIQFADIENHDDFYYHEDHRIHVRDQVGYWIVYDCALEDMK
ncbi:unnamed protein product [Schistocephalus solidus]|uniref:SEC63 domain-containing protein n=1 Tax=Schistocephalus solidus TaxID=70667 RepID=A0A183TPK7_SCHSO|nr:unnamed protein product [Schistocephalus solidus]